VAGTVARTHGARLARIADALPDSRSMPGNACAATSRDAIAAFPAPSCGPRVSPVGAAGCNRRRALAVRLGGSAPAYGGAEGSAGEIRGA
jgi:hypothetical protein